MKRKEFYFPELDALRTFAVALTLVAHFFPAVGWSIIPYSWYGVDIFFSISGFLITYILLLTKEAEMNRLHIVGNFMMRRILRLFPIYYLFLLVFYLGWKFFDLYFWKHDFTLYFFTYSPNLLFFKTGGGYGHPFSHLWSLGVEEQFYLIWPWVVIYLQRKWLFPVIILSIIAAYIINAIGYLNPNIKSLPVSNFHTLGGGALLAFFYHYRREENVMKFLREQRMRIFLSSFAIFVVLLLFYREGSAVWHLVREIGLSVVTVLFVLVSISGWKGISWLTQNRGILYLGKISYGIYLFHLPVPAIVQLIFQKTGISIDNPIALISLYVALTLGAAAFSYRYIESWFLNLKRRFA